MNRPLFPSRSGFPCKDCEDRTVGCHSICEKYIKAKVDDEQKRKERQIIAKQEDDYEDYKMQLLNKIKHNRRK